jgi:hypothetical protein
MDDDNSVSALGRNIVNETVAEVVVKAVAIPAFGGDGVDEDEAGVRSRVNRRVK